MVTLVRIEVWFSVSVGQTTRRQHIVFFIEILVSFKALKLHESVPTGDSIETAGLARANHGTRKPSAHLSLN
jgi:hypothetical protein